MFNLPPCADAPHAPTATALPASKSTGLLQFTRAITPVCSACTAGAASLPPMLMSPPSSPIEPFAKCSTFVREISTAPFQAPAGAPPICAGSISASLTILYPIPLQRNPLPLSLVPDALQRLVSSVSDKCRFPLPSTHVRLENQTKRTAQCSTCGPFFTQSHARHVPPVFNVITVAVI